MLLDTPLCDFGWQAPNFTLLDPVGSSYTMSEHLGDMGMLVMFICNHCPYVKAVATRMAEDMSELQNNGVKVLAVMSNDYHDYEIDNPPHMQQFSQQHGFTFPYLVDETQSVGKAYGAVCTPDFFGFNKNAELQYRGRLDSAGMGNAHGRKKELVDAMLQISKTGQGPSEQFPSMGCSIKWRT
ncbi:MAG: thioredoxin family protein [Acidiferrobacterales bacterium]|nr:thioredoxin family protein [Acidiferrobacterales bacterium]